MPAGVYERSENYRKTMSRVMKGKLLGSKNPRWKGGKKIDKDGYILVKRRDHPFANASGYVYEHRLVMEEIIGRYLTRSEDVHHINHDRLDNRIENLQLLTKSEHTILHNRVDMSDRKCVVCGKTETSITKNGRPDWAGQKCHKCYCKYYYNIHKRRLG